MKYKVGIVNTQMGSMGAMKSADCSFTLGKSLSIIKSLSDVIIGG